MRPEEKIVKTPEEAIETIKSNMPTSGYQMLRESLAMAIEALKEIQQYHEIGTVEYFEKLMLADNGTIWGLIDEYVDYKNIGTVEECREAVEKQKPKKPKDVEYDYSYFVCDACGEGIYVSDDFESHHYCLNCGRAIQWDEDLEETEDEL